MNKYRNLEGRREGRKDRAYYVPSIVLGSLCALLHYAFTKTREVFLVPREDERSYTSWLGGETRLNHFC